MGSEALEPSPVTDEDDDLLPEEPDPLLEVAKDISRRLMWVIYLLFLIWLTLQLRLK